MFKNAILYKISLENTPDVESCLQAAAFTPCNPSQEKSSGWVPPREVNGAMLESIGDQQILKLMTETKSVPADVINRRAVEWCAEYEKSAGRKPGKKETRDLKDSIRFELLPHAFPKQSATLVWIDHENAMMLVDASSQAKADDVVTALISAVPGVTVQMINTNATPSAAMAEWLLEQEGPTGFSIDRECELKATDESKAVVKYGKHRLDIGEVPDHIMAGKMPTKLAMTWDDRVSFVLTEALQIKKLSFLDVVFEDQTKDDAGGFDADVAIATGELRKLIPDLLDALGGEFSEQAETKPPGSVVEAAQNLQNMAIRDGYSVTVEDSAGQVLATFGEVDPMYQQAVDVVLANKKTSISLVQRHLRIGYNRASRLIEDMEKAGIVSPMSHNGERKVL